MNIAIIGLGRMGANMSRRLLRAGHHCFGYDLDPKKREELKSDGAVPLPDLEALKSKLDRPRAVWVMLPAGEVTEKTIERLASLLEPGDIVVNGGNSYFKDDVRYAKLLSGRGLRFVDAGVSGGIFGLERGYSLMVGGDAEAARILDPVFQTLAPPPDSSTGSRNYAYFGPAGAGHFVKMVHNGIEYGMMQAFAEGFDILQHAGSEKLPPEHRYSLDLRAIAQVWRHGSVVSSWLLDLIADALEKDPALSAFTGSVEDSGEGRWTVQAAVEQGVPAPVISTSLFVRFRSRERRSFAEQLLSAMRAEFGGIPKRNKKTRSRQTRSRKKRLPE